MGRDDGDGDGDGWQTSPTAATKHKVRRRDAGGGGRRRPEGTSHRRRGGTAAAGGRGQKKMTGFGGGWAGPAASGGLTLPTTQAEGRAEARSSKGGGASATSAAAGGDPTSLSDAIGSAVDSAIRSDPNDPLTGAIASMAATTLLASIDAFDLERNGAKEDEDALDGIQQSSAKRQPQGQSGSGSMTGPGGGQQLDFMARCRADTFSELLADYGEEDLDFAKMKVSSSDSPPSPVPPSKTNEHCRRGYGKRGGTSGVLAPHGKAPIHIELVSFGYHYGVPPEASGKGGWSSSCPLPPFDVRHLRRAPHFVAKLSGLSHQCKRELLNPRIGGGSEVEEKKAGKEKKTEPADKRSPLRRTADEVADEAASALTEAILVGGYGHASPLDVALCVGSEYGRHRSVVIVEAAAVALRNTLRRNDNDRFQLTPVSVGTRHRDIDRAHRDEKAFGFDLRREAQAAKRQREKEERAMTMENRSSRW